MVILTYRLETKHKIMNLCQYFEYKKFTQLKTRSLSKALIYLEAVVKFQPIFSFLIPENQIKYMFKPIC